MLKIRNLEVVYNDVILAVRGISLEVGDGDIVALLGSNGAGKSTTLKAITGLLKSQDGEIEEGKIELHGEDITGKDPEKISRLGVSLVPEERGILSQLTVDENIKVGAYTQKDKRQIKQDLTANFEYFPVLYQRRKQLAGYLSGGEQQMLAIARAVMSRPKILMMDEPSLGLAPLLVEQIFQIVQSINSKKGTTMLLVEQNAMDALSLAIYGYIMENGKIVLDGDTNKLMKNEDVREFYLGLSKDAGRKSYGDVKHYKRRKRWLSS